MIDEQILLLSLWDAEMSPKIWQRRYRRLNAKRFRFGEEFGAREKRDIISPFGRAPKKRKGRSSISGPSHSKTISPSLLWPEKSFLLLLLFGIRQRFGQNIACFFVFSATIGESLRFRHPRKDTQGKEEEEEEEEREGRLRAADTKNRAKMAAAAAASFTTKK